MRKGGMTLPSRLPTETSRPRADRSRIEKLNVEKLARDLRGVVQGDVRFDEGARALYATDGSNYRQPPIGAVVPKDKDDVVAAIEVCRAHEAPVFSRGGGTSLAGQCCNVAVVLDMGQHLREILELDQGHQYAVVQPGVVLDDLRNRAEEYHLTFAPDPSTHEYCTLGGMIGNNSCGVHSVMGGLTADNVEELEILTYDGLRMRVGETTPQQLSDVIAGGGRRGEIYAKLRDLRDRYGDLVRERYPRIPRRVSGYNLDELLPEKGFNVARALVGSESTCVTVLEAKVRLMPSPPSRSLLVLGYEDVYTAADHVKDVLRYGPIGLEGLDDKLIDYMKRKGVHPEDIELLPPGKGWLLVEFGGQSKDEADQRAHALMKDFRKGPSMKLFDDVAQEKKVWEVRESGLGATARVPGMPDTWEGWEDSAVPPERFGDYLRDLRKLFESYEYDGSFYGHFGQGCLHTRINFAMDREDGIRKYRSFIEDAADLVVSFGGSLSGEHGDGQSRAELLPKMFGPELVQAFGEFKAIWDPAGKMNPGKVVDPYRLDQNLRQGTGYNPARVETHFSYSDDKGDFAHAVLRCVGVGKCRREEGGIMCPSYMVTHEEKDVTRGRAHLLFEMLQGDPLKGGWKDDAVHDALDLCLACKGCKTECPMNVDMATYKAEFLSHYYEGRLRPRPAYGMGLIYWWSRLASKAPRTANAVARSKLGSLMKRLGGVAKEREIPRFATQTFVDWFGRRGAVDDPVDGRVRQTVMLWPDTFNNYLHPDTAKACVEVLEAAGYRVVIPPRPLCCGRPLYDYGMLPTAKKLLQQILDSLRPWIAAGVPLVGIEPSCLAVFRDELPNLFPNDHDARRLSENAFMFSEFLVKKATHWEPPQLKRRALLHGHCHQTTVIGMEWDQKLLDRMGLDYEYLKDAGCCGMAGSFGFEQEKYDVSVKVGERVLLPKVREADDDTLILMNGFSCQEQTKQLTERTGMHIAEAIALGLREEGVEPAIPPEAGARAPVGRRVVAVAAGAALLGLAVRRLRNHR
jgi:FAD/FMN-containing dehydrogenase/Fe-S oxidoreductase